MATVNEYGQTFAQWRARIDQILIANVGMRADDFADAPYWDCFADGITATEMIGEIAEYDEILLGFLAENNLIIPSYK